MRSIMIFPHPHLAARWADFVFSRRIQAGAVGTVGRRCDKLFGDDHCHRLAVTGSLVLTARRTFGLSQLWAQSGESDTGDPAQK